MRERNGVRQVRCAIRSLCRETGEYGKTAEENGQSRTAGVLLVRARRGSLQLSEGDERRGELESRRYRELPENPTRGDEANRRNIRAAGLHKRDGSEAWITTQSGGEVSGAKLPRYTAKHIEDSLKVLVERIEEVNRDKNSDFKVTQAVAFGDFLQNRSRVQAADVGIALEPSSPGDARPAARGEVPRQFLKTLRGRVTGLNLLSFESWMAARSHKPLM
jgi:hypothetical protein